MRKVGLLCISLVCCLVLCIPHIYHLTCVGGGSKGVIISSAPVMKTSKKQRSRVAVQSDSEDDKAGPRTSTPLGRSGEEGGFLSCILNGWLFCLVCFIFHYHLDLFV